MKYVKVYNKKQKDKLVEQDMLNWLLGKYIAYSFNEPKKYPTKPFLKDGTQCGSMSDKEMEEVSKRNCMKLGGEMIDGR